ncbi:hypothetical protein SAMN05660690_3336 [Geodermatophilus telluris]|uniref:Asp23 family, cell envelope-related function n=1 Tax=Geodermatophilus telluris TaxID=1190417 RepID=A0A1G6RXV5_9ACTN|nr:hypothetical protein [Geodermatophilus telluris]SDD08766.1 hypothetical protein SAMN05660690_3336 [Geodermatophilus telluris]
MALTTDPGDGRRRDDGPVPEVLAAATASARREDAALVPPPALLRRVMDAVRAEPRPSGAPVVLSAAPGARVEVAEAAVLRVVRAAVESAGDVRAGRCRVDAGGGVLRVSVSVSVTARAGVPLPELADRVRARVAAVAGATLGLPVAAVDVAVEDVT